MDGQPGILTITIGEKQAGQVSDRDARDNANSRVKKEVQIGVAGDEDQDYAAGHCSDQDTRRVGPSGKDAKNKDSRQPAAGQTDTL